MQRACSSASSSHHVYSSLALVLPGAPFPEGSPATPSSCDDWLRALMAASNWLLKLLVPYASFSRIVELRLPLPIKLVSNNGASFESGVFSRMSSSERTCRQCTHSISIHIYIQKHSTTAHVYSYIIIYSIVPTHCDIHSRKVYTYLHIYVVVEVVALSSSSCVVSVSASLLSHYHYDNDDKHDNRNGQ